MFLRRARLLALLAALTLAIAGCSSDCVPCSNPGATPDVLSAALNLCLSEVPNAGPDLRECTLVNLEYVIVD